MNIGNKIEYFGHVLSYYMHQNSLMWGRLTNCLTIQIVTIGSAYAVKSSLLSPILLIFGALLSMVFLLIFNRDRQIRDNNVKLLHDLAEKIHNESKDNLKHEFTTKIKPRGYAPFEGGTLFRLILIIIVFLELISGSLLLIWPQLLNKF